jgi:hypothetical protein
MENIPTSEEKIAHWLPEDDLVLLAIVGLKACISSRVNIINVIFVILLLSVL